MRYIQELRAELRAIRNEKDYLLHALADAELAIARLQNDRDEAQEIVMDIACEESNND